VRKEKSHKMAEVDITMIQKMVQQVLDQNDAMRAEFRREISTLRFDVENGFRALEQRLDGQMVERLRFNERLDGIVHQIRTLMQRLDRMDHE